MFGALHVRTFSYSLVILVLVFPVVFVLTEATDPAVHHTTYLYANFVISFFYIYSCLDVQGTLAKFAQLKHSCIYFGRYGVLLAASFSYLI